MDLLQFIAAVLTLAGIYMYGFKTASGPILSCIACLLWLIATLHYKLPWMALLNIVLAGMHFINLARWRHTNGTF